MVSLECSIWELANLLQFIIFSLLCEMGESSSKFRIPKTSNERKTRLLSILFRNLRFTRTNGRYRFFENGKAKEQTRFAPLSQAECLKGKTFVWMCKSWLKALKTWMPKVWTTGYASSFRRLQISRVDALQYCLRLKTFLGGEKWRGRIKSIGCQR